MPSVTVYSFRAVGERELTDRCFALLSREEQLRAMGIREGSPREEFVTGRAMLRVLLGRELGVTPAQLVFESGPHGKPVVPGICFNLSHSHGRLVAAVSRGLEVGVDVELVGDSADVMDVAQSHFSRAEQAFVAKAADRTRAFLRVWTRKEAVLKALGCGLSDTLGSLEVLGSPVRLQGRDVHVQDLAPGAGLVGAIAGVAQAFEVVPKVHAAAEIEALLRDG